MIDKTQRIGYGLFGAFDNTSLAKGRFWTGYPSSRQEEAGSSKKTAKVSWREYRYTTEYG
jgi:hypothetical protein